MGGAIHVRAATIPSPVLGLEKGDRESFGLAGLYMGQVRRWCGMDVSAGGSRLGVLHSPWREPRCMISRVGRNGHAWRGERSEVGGGGERS